MPLLVAKGIPYPKGLERGKRKEEPYWEILGHTREKKPSFLIYPLTDVSGEGTKREWGK